MLIIKKLPIIFKYPSFIGLLAIGLLVATGRVGAQSITETSNWRVSLALGAGVRTNPVMDNDNIPLIVIPQISYQGEHFFIQNLDLGYTLFEDEKQQFNLLLTPSYDQVFFNKSGINNFVDATEFASSTKSVPTVELVNDATDRHDLHKRRMAGLAGFEYSRAINEVDLQLQVLHEMTRYYHGNEVRVALSKGITLGKNDVKLTIGANWQDSATLNYFYGLTEAEAIEPYVADQGITGLLRFDWNYDIDAHWSLRFFTSYRHLSNSVTNSPLVTDKNVVTAFAGGVYHF